MSFLREEINNDLLIHELEKRPPLYNRDLKQYNDYTLRKQLWEEVTQNLFPSWPRMNADQKDKAIRDTQKRWKNLRACFTRELRLRKFGPFTPKRRQYVYFNKLLFLSSSIDLQDDKTEDIDNDDDNDKEEELLVVLEDSIDDPLDEPEKKKRKKDNINNTFVEANEKRDKSIVYNDIDSDKNFALSIVPMLRTLSIDQKLDARIAILKVLRKFIVRDGECSKTGGVKTEIEFDDSE